MRLLWVPYIGCFYNIFQLLSFVAGGTTVTGLLPEKLQSGGKVVNETLALSVGAKSSAGLNDRAMQHPLCANNANAYVGQTAKMYCCLARLDRELSVSNEPVSICAV